MRRRILFAATLVVGLALAVFGFFMSAPIGPMESPKYSNPELDFAPLIFLVGVVVSISSAVVYELAGDGRGREDQQRRLAALERDEELKKAA